MDLVVRRPGIDFTGLSAHWCEHTEFAQTINAFSFIPTHIEPFLIKVMKRAKDELLPHRDERLIAEIEWFNKQEAQHYRLHGAMNRAVRNQGYETVDEPEGALIADYEHRLATQSLDELLAFAEGFEAIGPHSAKLWLGDGGWANFLAGADPRVPALWRWHFAEEFEHRSVVWRTFHRVCGADRERAYGLRMHGLQDFVAHATMHLAAFQAALLGVDQQQMPADELARSREREQQVVDERQAALESASSIASPDYDPERLEAPRFWRETLDGLDDRALTSAPDS